MGNRGRLHPTNFHSPPHWSNNERPGNPAIRADECARSDKPDVEMLEEKLPELACTDMLPGNWHHAVLKRGASAPQHAILR